MGLYILRLKRISNSIDLRPALAVDLWTFLSLRMSVRPSGSNDIERHAVDPFTISAYMPMCQINRE